MEIMHMGCSFLFLKFMETNEYGRRNHVIFLVISMHFPGTNRGSYFWWNQILTV